MDPEDLENDLTPLLEAQVPDALNGQRFDRVLAELFPQFSRARLQCWIKEAKATVNGQPARAKDAVLAGSGLQLMPEVELDTTWTAEPIALDVVYEDESLLVINKPPGLVVHPAAGNYSGTLVNALLHRAPELAGLPRAGIVHRLDKDTSGLLVVARNVEAHHSLVGQLQAREVSRIYLALVDGVMVSGGTVDAPIARHSVDRQRMAVVAGGREALTHYRIRERFRAHTLLEVRLETGRTHQIRVHMAHIHHAVVGDPVYGRLRIPKGCAPAVAEVLRGFRRQALHAQRLELDHPRTGGRCSWTAPAPGDLQALLTVLRTELHIS